MKPNYDKFPCIQVKGFDDAIWIHWDKIIKELTSSISLRGQKRVIVVECYQGLYHDDITQIFKGLTQFEFFDVASAYKSPEQIRNMVHSDVTDDRIFGKLTKLNMQDYFDSDRLSKLKTEIQAVKEKPVIVYGTGASEVMDQCDRLVYFDLARWEIQLRMRKNEVNNLGVENKTAEFSHQYKQAYFVDWRVCDRIKAKLLNRINYLVDTNDRESPKMITGDALRGGLKQASMQPFRVKPFFDPGPWGGQWMKEVCDLDRDEINYAWCFDCVPEENSLLLKFNDQTIEIPSIDLLLQHPVEILGQETYQIMGPEFPIRFDFLDTMQGGNLSLQVHPTVDYIRQEFGMTYTQDESYYLLDAGDKAIVYLGLKEDVDPGMMISDLQNAQHGGESFNAEKHVKVWNVKKHDHVLIPAGTVHCSGEDSMVLEISATPYIFTFKLWDWGRLGLDGKPRPINIAHGEKVIDWSRTEKWTKDNLINRFKAVDSGEGWREESTGLHELEFIETRRHWFTGPVKHQTNGLVNVLNLVEGREVIVESPTSAFDPFIVHYAETFIIPAGVRDYIIRPFGEGEGTECGTLKASVRIETLRGIGDDLWMMPKEHNNH